MTEAEKLLKSAGAVPGRHGDHIIYYLNGVRFSLHRGNRPNPQEIYRVKKLLRRMGKL